MDRVARPAVVGRDPLPLRALDTITQGMNVCGTALILALMALICGDVLGRNILGHPIAGVPELVTLSIVAIVFLQVPQALRAGRIPQSDVFKGFLDAPDGRIGPLIADLYDLAGAAVMGIIVYATVPLLDRAFARGEYIGSIGDFTAPTWPVKATVILGATVMSLQFLARILRRHGTGLRP